MMKYEIFESWQLLGMATKMVAENMSMFKKLKSDGFDDQIVLKFLSLKFLPTTIPKLPIPRAMVPKTTFEFNQQLQQNLISYDPKLTVRNQLFLRQKIPFIELLKAMENSIIEPDSRTLDLVCAHCFLIKDFKNARLNIPNTSYNERSLFKSDSFTAYLYDLDVKGATNELKLLLELKIKPEPDSLVRYLNLLLQDLLFVARTMNKEIDFQSGGLLLFKECIIEFGMQQDLKILLNRLLKRKLVLGDGIANPLHKLMVDCEVEVSPAASEFLG